MDDPVYTLIIEDQVIECSINLDARLYSRYGCILDSVTDERKQV